MAVGQMALAQDTKGGSNQAAAVQEGGTADTLPQEVLGPFHPEAEESHDWSEGRARWFIAGTVDLGYLFARPRFTFGYGKPHYKWLGVDANPLYSGEGVGAYVGVRGTLPNVDLRIGARGFYTFRRSFLCPTEDYLQPGACADEPRHTDYDRDGLENRVGPHSRYITFETELTIDQPLGPGSVISELAASAVTLVHDGFFAYEERIRVIVDPPWILRARLGYLFPLEPSRSIRVGLAVEVVSVPRRDMLVLRGGIFGGIRLYRDLEARGAFIPALAARDNLGAAGGDRFFLGVRYRWSD